MSIKYLNELKKDGETLSGSDIMMLLQSYQKMEAKPETIAIVASDIPESVSLYNDNDLQYLYHYLQGYQAENDGFDRAFFAVRDEINIRKKSNFEIDGY